MTECKECGKSWCHECAVYGKQNGFYPKPKDSNRCPYCQSYRIENVYLKDSETSSSESSGGCYVATCVYGSYDCPEVRALRRFRDNTLSRHLLGRAFIRAYYALSPPIVRCFGKMKWFHKFWRTILGKIIRIL